MSPLYAEAPPEVAKRKFPPPTQPPVFCSRPHFTYNIILHKIKKFNSILYLFFKRGGFFKKIIVYYIRVNKIM